MAPNTTTDNPALQAQVGAAPVTQAQLQALLEQFNNRITQLEAENGQLQQEINEASLRAGTKAKAKMELPDKYGGEKELLDGFLTEMQSYLQYYPEKFPDEDSKVKLAASRLKDKALRWFASTLKDRLKNDREDQDNFTQRVFRRYENFEEEISKVFGDQDKKLHAQERLARLKQTKSAAAYTTLFRQDSLRAEINDEGLMQMFYEGLKDEVKDELYKVDRPDELDEYIAMAIRIDDRLYSCKQQRRGKGSGSIMSGQYQANTKKQRRARTTAYGTHAGPMDVSANQRQPQKKFDKSKVTCFNCGKKGHYKRDCKSAKTWSPAPGKETAAVRTAEFEVAAAPNSDKRTKKSPWIEG